MREITGVPGLIARAYENDEWVGHRPEPSIKDDPENHRYLVEDGPHKGWRFLSTASRDQYTGVFWGNATVYELFDDPGMRGRASANIVSVGILRREGHYISFMDFVRIGLPFTLAATAVSYVFVWIVWR